MKHLLAILTRVDAKRGVSWFLVNRMALHVTYETRLTRWMIIMKGLISCVITAAFKTMAFTTRFEIYQLIYNLISHEIYVILRYLSSWG